MKSLNGIQRDFSGDGDLCWERERREKNREKMPFLQRRKLVTSEK